MKCQLPVMRLFDDDFEKEIGEFVNQNFEHHRYRKLMCLFYSNVFQCRSEHFDENSVLTLNSFVEEKVFHKGNSQKKRGHLNNNFLKSYPRLKSSGIGRYQRYQDDFFIVHEAYQKAELPRKSHIYFKFLPEVNFYELFSLLDPKLYQDDRPLYVERLKKYLFFFGYAIDKADHPVFFIDDVLFECLKFYPTYQKPLDDILSQEEEYVIWMMSLARSRKKLQIDVCKDVILDRENLRNMNDYVKKIPGIESPDAISNLRQLNEVLNFRTNCKLLVGDTMYEMCFSNRKRTFSSFRPHILKAAIVFKNGQNIRKIVYYNAYSGIETSLIVPPVESEIIEFISKYNKPKSSRPEAFIFSVIGQYLENI